MKAIEQEKVKFIGIDPGNNACKYAMFFNGGIKYGQIPNVTGPAIRLDFPPSGHDENLLSVEILSAEDTEHRNPQFIGELARTQLQEQAEQDRSRNKVESDSVNLVLPAVLGLIDTGEKIVLGVGATIQDYGEQAPQLQCKLTRQHEVKFNLGSRSGQIVRPEVIVTYTYGQAAAGLLGMLRTDAGRIARTDWIDSVVLAVDFGHGQINVAVMDGLQLVRQACFSVDFGFYRVFNSVQSFLNAKPHYVTATIPQLKDPVEKGYYMKNNNQIDLTRPIDEACAQIMDMLYREIKSRVSPVLFDRISHVVSMGGGGATMAPFVGSRFGMSPEIARDAMFANARGLLLVAKERWEKVNG